MSAERIVRVNIPEQRLYLEEGGRILLGYSVSTAKNGAGEQQGSEQTPCGWHRVRVRIGADCPVNTVFRARRPTGEIYSPELAATNPGRDWILSRVLWLTGLEPGRNRGGAVDTLRRFIYVHGTPDENPMGVPLSHGCVRMRNGDIVELFEQVPPGTRVLIEGPAEA